MKGEQEARMVCSAPRLQGRWKKPTESTRVGGRKGISCGGLGGGKGSPRPPVWTAASPANIWRRIRPSQRPDQTEPLLPHEEDRERLFVGREVLFVFGFHFTSAFNLAQDVEHRLLRKHLCLKLRSFTDNL